MRIDQLLAERREPIFSFEFFPPKTPAGEENLAAALTALRELSPSFVSVTKTGDASQAQTIELVSRIRAEHGLEAVAHFTCGDISARQARASLDLLRDAGHENVLALRGDEAPGGPALGSGGLAHASDLVELVAAEYGLCTIAACYPEVHTEAGDADSDLEWLRAKVAAGAQVLITQLFFANDAYFSFVARARGAGIDVPIVPGIMPITNVEQITRFTSMCGASIPPALREALAARADDPAAAANLGVAYATLQCAELLAGGAPGVHFYTLNRSPSTRAVLSALRLTRPWEQAPQPAGGVLAR